LKQEPLVDLYPALSATKKFLSVRKGGVNSTKDFSSKSLSFIKEVALGEICSGE